MVAWLLLALRLAEVVEGEGLSASFSDGSQAGVFEARVLSGTLVVKGYEGKEVRVSWGEGGQPEAGPEEMRRLNAGASGIWLRAAGNTIRLGMSVQVRSPELTVLVPVKTQVKVQAVAGRSVRVEEVEGDVEVIAGGAAVELENVTGAVKAQTLKGAVKARLKTTAEGKAVRIRSSHGDIDVTLGEGAKAKLRMETRRGKVMSNLDLKAQKQEGARVTEGELNGGGVEYGFQTGTGNIYIRKGQ